jgi:hypothetical protein
VVLLSLLSFFATACLSAEATTRFSGSWSDTNGGWKNGATNLSITVTPSAIAQGDMLIATIVCQTGTMTAVPTGWTLLLSSTNDAYAREYVYAKEAGANEPSTYTFIGSASKGISGIIADYRSDLSGISVDSCSSSSTWWDQNTPYTATIPGITTVSSNTTLVMGLVGHIFCGTGQDYTDQFSVPTGATNELSIQTVYPSSISAGYKDRYVIDDQVLNSSGFTGDISVTQTITQISGTIYQGANGFSYLIALSD